MADFGGLKTIFKKISEIFLQLELLAVKSATRIHHGSTHC